MQLRARASVDVNRPIAEVFDYSVAGENFATMMRGRGLIPGVERVVLIDTKVVKSGIRRRVELTDKSYIIEEVLVFERPTKHAYRWDSKLKFPLSLLVEAAATEWTFSTTPSGGTHIDWTYTFTPTTVLVYPLAAIMVGQFRSWMAQSLQSLNTAMTSN